MVERRFCRWTLNRCARAAKWRISWSAIKIRYTVWLWLGPAAEQTAEDVFQEVFLAYFQSNKAFRDEEHQKAWLLSDHDQFLPAGHLLQLEEKDGPSFPAGRQASSLPVRGRKLRVAGCDGAGGVPPCPHLPLLFSGADHTGNRPRSVYPSWCGPNAVVPVVGRGCARL